MDRFYQNLITRKLPKAEAKTWLRNLSSEDALKHSAAISNGVVRGKDEAALPVVLDVPKPTKQARPFDQPKYWAAFILIGDSN